MRRTVVVLALLALFLPAAAADKPWPAKGDVVYIPWMIKMPVWGGLALTNRPIPYSRLSCDNTRYCIYTLMCDPLTIRKIKKKGTTAFLINPVGVDVVLSGDWRDLLVRDQRTCLSGMAADSSESGVALKNGHKYPHHFEVVSAHTSTAPSD